MGTEDVQTVRDGPNPIRLKTSCREYPDVRITQVHGPEGGSYQRVRIWEARRFLSRVPKAEGCTFYVLNGMPLPCFLLHSPFIHHFYRSIVLLSITRLGKRHLPLSLTDHLPGRVCQIAFRLPSMGVLTVLSLSASP